MLTITQEQIMARWDTLPESLREALTSEVNSDFLWKTCEGEHMPDEKIYYVAREASLVLFGFLHPEDLGLELKDALGLDAQTAGTIAHAIDSRIYTPLRPEIDKVYAPPSKFGAEIPKMIDI